jgi:hypothetical protein
MGCGVHSAAPLARSKRSLSNLRGPLRMHTSDYKAFAPLVEGQVA